MAYTARHISDASRYLTSDPARALNWLAKIALVAMLLLGLIFPDWQQFQDKAWPARAAAYPIAALVVPIWWWFKQRSGKPNPPQAAMGYAASPSRSLKP